MSLVYLGLPPRANQAVPPSLASKDIHLQRVSPSSLSPVVTVDKVQPMHAVFAKFLNVYVAATMNAESRPLSTPYAPVAHRGLPVFFRRPMLVWSYGARLTAESIDALKDRYNAEETVIKGKPGFMAELDHEEVIKLIGETPSPIETTPSNNNCMNIKGYRAYIGVHRMYDAIMRTNQYPYMNNDEAPVDDNNLSHARTYLRVSDTEITRPEDSMTSTVDIRPSMVRAFSNVPTPFDQFSYTIKGPSDLPADTTGMLFPYNSDLALPDRETITSFLYRHMFYSFGASREDAESAFLEFKSSWGSAAGTTWENELTHMYFVLGVAIEAQATVRVMIDNASRYQGSIILGGGFSVTLPAGSYHPLSPSALRTTLPKATPHLSALATIFSSIGFASNEVRKTRRESCSSIHQIRAAISETGILETKMIELKEALHLVSFPDDERYLAPTAANIKSILDAMADTDTDLTRFPMYPPMVIESDRRLRLLSAFGPNAPSFRVPGGKEMRLDTSFSTSRRGAGGRTETVAVSKLACILKPVREAYADLSTVIVNQAILNPYGSSVVNRISSQSLLRTYESDSAKMILESLRRVSGISDLIVVSASASKRKGDDMEQDDASKRPRVFEL